jgi:hypothetical protein
MPRQDKRTEVEFRRVVISRYLPALLKLLTHKGEQYAGKEEPALINFYEGSKLSDQTPAHYLMSQASKQWYVISNWSKTDPEMLSVSRREVVQRLFDVCVYMMLLLFMIENEGQTCLPGEEK